MNRQERWELKREVLFEATKRLADFSHVVHVVFAEAFEYKTYDDCAKGRDSLGRAQVGITETFNLVDTVCEKETVKAMRKVSETVLIIMMSVWNNKNHTRDMQFAFWESVSAARAAIRKELEIDDTQDVVDGKGI
jgi:hypothetical protein